jgi:hypothetical protein
MCLLNASKDRSGRCWIMEKRSSLPSMWLQKYVPCGHPHELMGLGMNSPVSVLKTMHTLYSPDFILGVTVDLNIVTSMFDSPATVDGHIAVVASNVHRS